jgi:predicted NBD/HSP70 family sugar kinase
MYLAIDIGGTKTLIALFSRRGRVIRRRKFKTAQGYKSFMRDLETNLEGIHGRRIKSVTVAIPGIVQKNYSVKFGNRNWQDIDLIGLLKKLFDCPIWFENDANLASLYEGYRLPGKTVFLTFSTGIGGGIVEKNRILPESNALEPGHVIYEYDGVKREWEDIAAASAIESHYHVDRATDLRKKEIMQDIAKRMSLGLPDIITKYHPRTIVLGGPMGRVFRLFEPYLPKDLNVKLRRPRRPNESVIYGCYLYSKQKELE